MTEPERMFHELKKGGFAHSTLTGGDLLHLAFRDPLTGLLNRRGFEVELGRIWNLGQQHSLSIGLLIIDIDHFKAMNDSHGHAVGDQVLKECATLMQAAVRESDVVCRYYGGDEFVVILPAAEAAITRSVAERMLENFRTQVVCKGTYDLQATISIGACNMTAGPDQSEERFFIQADRALYRAKRAGRNRVCFADEVDAPGAPADDPVARTGPVGVKDDRRVVLVVDDDPSLCAFFERALTRGKFDVLTAKSGAAAKEIATRERGMIDIALVDLHLGNENGLDLLKDLRIIDESMVGVIITGQASLDSAVDSLRLGAYDFIQKPATPTQLTAAMERAVKYRRLVLENKRYQQHLEDMVRVKSAALSRALEQVRGAYQSTLEAMADMLDKREQMTSMHSQRVARLSIVLAREMGVSTEELKTIETGALLHDIGKIAIPDSILLKPAPLSAEEREIIKKHPQFGYDIIHASPFLAEASELVLSHHEHYDGAGYPRGLKGDDICPGARIFAVVDAYDAIRTDRPYSKGRSAAEALDEILRHKGTQFDPVVVDALRRCPAEIEKVGNWPSP